MLRSMNATRRRDYFFFLTFFQARNTQHVKLMMKGLFFFVVLAFAITWVSASFAGGDMEIAELVIDFMIYSFVLIAFMAVSIFGWDQITKAMFKLRIMKKMRYIAESDATKPWQE